MIEKRKQKQDWWEEWRVPEKFIDSEDFVKGYNQALEDFDLLFGTKQRPDGKWRGAGMAGGNQVHSVCEEWKLEFKK